MPYLVSPNQLIRKSKGIPLESLLCDDLSPEQARRQKEKKRYKKSVYVTKITDQEAENLKDKNRDKIYDLIRAHNKLIIQSNQKILYPNHFYYRSFQIPKKSGGMRQIEAPSYELKRAQSDCVEALFKPLHQPRSSSAFAFAKGRNTLDSLKRHQYNKSRWYLKLDIHNFFGSTDIDTVVSQLNKIYPYCTVKTSSIMDNVKDTMKAVFMNDSGRLPQGAPSSPTLANVIMIPFDYEFSKWCREKGFIYTRYADDLLISHKDGFKYSEVVNKVKELFNELGLPYKLKDEKTRYGSYKGRNMNLGLMCNGNYDITIGHKTKKRFKAMLTRIATSSDVTAHELNKINGLYSYYLSIEPEYIKHLIQKYSVKYMLDLECLLRVQMRVPIRPEDISEAGTIERLGELPL